jgi:hypothetical protein
MREKAAQSVVLRGSRFTSHLRFVAVMSWGNIVTELSAKEYIDQIEVLAVSPLICVD